LSFDSPLPSGELPRQSGGLGVRVISKMTYLMIN